MPRSIADIRKANGGLGNLSDEDIVQNTFSSFKNYYKSEDEYAKSIGYSGAGRSLTSSRLSAGVDNYQSNLYGTAGAVARGLGLPSGVSEFADRGRDRNQQASEYAQERAKQLGGVDDFRDIDGVGSAFNYVGGLAAQSLPYAAEAVVGGLTGGAAFAGTAARMGLSRGAAMAAGRTAGATVAGYPSAVGDILSSQRQENGSENLPMALAGGVPYAAANSLFGVEGALARGGLARNTVNLLDNIKDAKGFAARTGATVGRVSAAEGTSETAQELINQSFGRMAVNPEQTLFNDEANKRYMDSFVGGAALGGAFGSVGGGRRSAGYVDPNAAVTPTVNVLEPDAAPKPRRGLDTRAIVDQGTGVGFTPYAGKEYAKQFEQAAAEPTGQRNTGINGVETDETALDSVQRQSGVLSEERQRAEDDRQRAQAIKDNADALTATRNRRDERAGQFGVDPTKGALTNLFGQLEDAHKQGVIDDAGVAQGLSFLQGGDAKSATALLKTATEEQTRQNDTSVLGTVNRATGVGNKPVAGKKYGSQFEAAASALTGERTNDANGIEVNETALESMQRNSGLLEQKRKDDAVAKANTDAVAKEKTELDAAAATAGVNPRSKKAMDLYSQLRDAHREGLINTAALNETTEQINASKFAAVDRFLKGIYAQQEAVTSADAAAKNTDFKGPTNDAAASVPTAQATAASPTGAAPADTGTAPAATAIANVTPANSAAVVPATVAAKSNPVAAKPDIGTPQARAVKALKAVGISGDSPITVTRNGKPVETTALELWTRLLSNPKAVKRAQMAMGADGDWRITGSPMSFADIAKAEGVSKQAVTQQLDGFGIKETVLDRVVAGSAALSNRGITVEEENDGTANAEKGKGSDYEEYKDEQELTRPEDATVSEEVADTGLDPKGMRSGDTLAAVAGEGRFLESENSAQKKARVLANTLLGEGKVRLSQENAAKTAAELGVDPKDLAPNDKRQTEIDKDLDRAITARSLEDERQLEVNKRRAKAEAEKAFAAILSSPHAGNAEADWNDTKRSDSPAFEDMLAGERAELVYTYKDAVDAGMGQWSTIEAALLRFEKDLDNEKSRNATDTGAANGSPDASSESRSGASPASDGEAQGRKAGPAPVVSVKKRKVIERSDAPERSESTQELIDLRKRESVLRSLIKCMGG